ncbi:uncharacterized protein LOC141649358 [Silene latifolia]|uniref:uncharacterized protein LOC141649358 n=1 Tax=Silene latifolia TaxID=37657 RepID=UPI003D76E7B0
MARGRGRPPKGRTSMDSLSPPAPPRTILSRNSPIITPMPKTQVSPTRQPLLLNNLIVDAVANSVSKNPNSANRVSNSAPIGPNSVNYIPNSIVVSPIFVSRLPDTTVVLEAKATDIGAKNDVPNMPASTPTAMASSPTVANKKWSDVAKPKVPISMSLYFHQASDSAEEIDVALEDIVDELKIWEFTLMGHLLGSRQTLKQITEFVSKSWSHIAYPVVQYFKKGWFSFRFSSEEEMNNVLKDGPSKMGSYSLILKQWHPSFSFEMDKVSIVPIWVLFPDLDPYLWSPTVLSKMSSKIGRPMFADLPTTNKEKLSFARVMIEVDIASNLPLEISLNTPFRPSVQRIEYEWIPHYCAECGKMGHLKQTCKLNKAKLLKAQEQKKKPQYVAKISPSVLGGASITIGVSTGSLDKEISSGPNLGSVSSSSELVPSTVGIAVHSECTRKDKASQFQIALKRDSLLVSTSTSIIGNNPFTVLSLPEEGEIITETPDNRVGDLTEVEQCPNHSSKENFSVTESATGQNPCVLGGTSITRGMQTNSLENEESSECPRLGLPNSSSELVSSPTGIVMHSECTKKDTVKQSQIALKRDSLPMSDPIMVVPCEDSLVTNTETLATVDQGSCNNPSYQVSSAVTPCLDTGPIQKSILRNSPSSGVHKQVDVLGLLETGVKQHKAKKILRNSFRRYNAFCNYNKHNNGRIWLLLNPTTTTVEILEEHSQVVHYKIKHLATGRMFFLSVVYGSNNAGIRQKVWDSLTNFAHKNECWTVMGDFNVIRHPLRKSGISDHNPALLTFHDNDYPKKQFKFVNCWVEHPQFGQIVTECWETSHPSNSMFRLMNKLEKVKMGLKKLHVNQFANISSRVKDKRDELAQCYQDLQSRPDFASLFAQEQKLSQELWHLKEIEIQILYQRAKSQGIKYIDTFSKYFFAKIKERQQSQMIGDIHGIDGIDGTHHKGLHNVGEAFVDYYQQLLGENTYVLPIAPELFSKGNCVEEHDYFDLTKPITRLEIKAELFSIDSNKSPGVDGFSSGFFKAAWTIIEHDLCTAIEDFFKTGFMPKQANVTLVTLIPKKQTPQTIKDFRPISCCSTIYKIISKILTNGLKLIMPSLVGPEQAAFVSGRRLFENVILTQNLVKGYTRKHITPRCMLKIDISKAFDTLQWEFIQSMLEGLKFPPMFTKWIMGCVSGSWFTLKINGSHHGFFKGRSGVRQGDPLSPFLFVLSMEVLSRSLRGMCSIHGVSYHPKCSRLKLTHLVFADDLMIFTRGDLPSV